MPDRHYPRFGCTFCITNRDKVEQLMKHFDEHLSELMDAKMKARRPAGDHALELIRAVRRCSDRKGLNTLIQLKPSAFDGCRNWCLYEVIDDEAEYVTFMRRRCHPQQEWLQLANQFLESSDAVKFGGHEKAARNTYKPDWSNLDETKSVEDEDDDDDDEDDDDDDDDDEEEIAWKKYLEAAKAKNAARKAKLVLARPGMQGNLIDARNQSVSMSPVKPQGGKYSIFALGGINEEGTISSRKAELGNARMKKYVGNIKHRENDFDDAVKKEDDKKGNQKAYTAKDKGKGKEKRPHPDLIDLTTPVKSARIHSPSPADDDDETFDIDTPKQAKTITLFVKCFDDNGLYEIDASCALETAIRMVERRMKGIRIKCFRSEGKTVTVRMWEKMVSKVLVVTADWEFDDDEE